MDATCQQCGQEFVTFPSRVKSGRARFCGKACYSKWMSENIRGEAHPRKGKRHTPEALAKMKRAKANGPTGAAHPSWKGGWYLTKGYVMVALSTLGDEERALYASMAKRSSNRAIPEHRLVMARHVGRALKRTEVVHHRNGIRKDNRIENLELYSPRAHQLEHHRVIAEMKELRQENERLRSELLSLKSQTAG